MVVNPSSASNLTRFGAPWWAMVWLFMMAWTLFVSPAVLGGLCVLGRNVVRGDDPRISDILSGISSIKRYLTWLGMFWLWFAYLLLAGIAILVIDRIAALAAIESPDVVSRLSVPVFLVASSLLYCYPAARCGWSWHLVANGRGVIDALQCSLALTLKVWFKIWLLFSLVHTLAILIIKFYVLAIVELTLGTGTAVIPWILMIHVTWPFHAAIFRQLEDQDNSAASQA